MTINSKFFKQRRVRRPRKLVAGWYVRVLFRHTAVQNYFTWEVIHVIGKPSKRSLVGRGVYVAHVDPHGATWRYSGPTDKGCYYYFNDMVGHPHKDLGVRCYKFSNRLVERLKALKDAALSPAEFYCMWFGVHPTEQNLTHISQRMDEDRHQETAFTQHYWRLA